MSGLRTVRIIILSTGIAALTGCDAVERVRTRFGATTTDTVITATGSGLALGLQAPGALRPGDEGVLRLTLTNNTDTAVANVRLELIVPEWVEPMPPRAGERPVTMSALENGSTVFSYGVTDAPLTPGQLQTVDQRIRVPAAGSLSRGNAPWTRTVRARLLAANGNTLADVQTGIAVDSAALVSASPTTEATTITRREQVGPVVLGMNTATVKQAVPNTRDTTWSQGGARQRGILVPIANQHAFAVLAGDAVARIEVGHPAIQTAERLGVGSRMSELRAAYGAACADVIGGRVVAWFAAAPGMSFILNAPVPRNVAEFEPANIPDNAQVTRWWVSKDAEICPSGG
ncbi:MAG TPA: hypothetical protein VFZ04_21820 [Longimicrobiales bacterium]